jgi:site-specific recombinase XerD
MCVESVLPKDVDVFKRVASRMYCKRKLNRRKSGPYWRIIHRRYIGGFLRFRLGEWPTDPGRFLVAPFKTHLEKLHYSDRVIEKYLWVARSFVRYLEERGLSLDESQPSDITGFVQVQFKRYCKRHGHAPPHERHWAQYTAPVHLLLRMLKPQWRRPTPPASPAERFQQKILDRYARWLTDVQGLSRETLRKNGWAAKEFLSWLADNARVATDNSLRRLSIDDLDRYLAWRLPSLRRATRVSVSGSLRSFLRYLYAVKLIAHDLAAAVSAPSLYEYEDIPRAFTQQQIETVLTVTRRDRSATGLRDYAMLLLLATYGIRAGEVIRLRLEDIDWRQERIRVLQSKTHRELFLPLVAPVAEAILHYLCERPQRTEDREVFLRVRAPRGRLVTTSSLAAVIRRRLQEAGIVVSGRHGSHAFRFARAVSLLRASVPVKWISDVLGHVAASSTQTYLRLATDDLRALSLEVPGRKRENTLAG